MNTVIAIIGMLGTLSSVFFACIAFRKNENQDAKNDGKNQGSIFSDIGYIKACVDRVEKNLYKVDERYKDMVERLAKVEEALSNVTKRVDEIYKKE